MSNRQLALWGYELRGEVWAKNKSQVVIGMYVAIESHGYGRDSRNRCIHKCPIMSQFSMSYTHTHITFDPDFFPEPSGIITTIKRNGEGVKLSLVSQKY